MRDAEDKTKVPSSLQSNKPKVKDQNQNQTFEAPPPAKSQAYEDEEGKAYKNQKEKKEPKSESKGTDKEKDKSKKKTEEAGDDFATKEFNMMIKMREAVGDYNVVTSLGKKVWNALKSDKQEKEEDDDEVETLSTLSEDTYTGKNSEAGNDEGYKIAAQTFNTEQAQTSKRDVSADNIAESGASVKDL